MGTFKERAGSLFRQAINRRQVLSRIWDYKFSIGTSALCALFEAVAILLEEDFHIVTGVDEDAVFRFLVLAGEAALLSETCFMGKKRLKFVGLFSGVVLSGLITYFIGVDEDRLLFGIKGVFFYKKAQELMAGCIFLMLVLTVYFSYRKTAVRFEKFMLAVFTNWLIVFSLYVILLIGVGLVCGCVDALLIEGRSSIVSISWVLISGFFLVPGGILALDGRNHEAVNLPNNKPDNEAARRLNNKPESEAARRLLFPVQYLLSLMAFCALVSVYIYAVKILVTWEFPSNQVFSILTKLFCLGMPIWMVTDSLLKESRCFRIVARLPYAFAPLILLQIYSIAVRIADLGLTPDRYAGVMMIIFEVGTLLCWHFQRNRMENVLLIMSGLIVLAFLVPGINMYRLSERWQQTWLEKYYQASLSGESLSPQEYKRMKGAYFYLKDNTPEGMAGGYDGYKDIDRQEAFTEKIDRYSIHGCQLVGGLSVEGFMTMHMAEEAEGQPEPDFSGFRFRLRGTDEEITVDISDFAKKAMAYAQTHPDADKEEISGYLRGFNRIDIGQGRVLYINHFQISFDKGIRDGRDYFKWNGVRNISGIVLSAKEDAL